MLRGGQQGRRQRLSMQVSPDTEPEELYRDLHSQRTVCAAIVRRILGINTRLTLYHTQSVAAFQ